MTRTRNTATGTDNWGGTVQVTGRIRGHFAVGPNDNVYFTSTDRRVFASPRISTPVRSP